MFRSRRQAIVWLRAVAVAAILCALASAIANRIDPRVGSLAVVAGIGIYEWLTTALREWLAPMRIRRVARGYIYFKGAGREFLESLPEEGQV